MDNMNRREGGKSLNKAIDATGKKELINWVDYVTYTSVQ